MCGHLRHNIPLNIFTWYQFRVLFRTFFLFFLLSFFFFFSTGEQYPRGCKAKSAAIAPSSRRSTPMLSQKSFKMNQGPQLVLIYYKTYFIGENFQTKEADDSYRLNISSDQYQTQEADEVYRLIFFSLKFLRLNMLISS